MFVLETHVVVVMMLNLTQLSATMLGDNAERSKNPLKKAMRRRNAKTVQFCDPTYYEASDVDYSTDEEEEQDQDGIDDGGNEMEPNNVQHEQPDDQDEITAVEPLRPSAPATKTNLDTAESVANAPDANEVRVRSSTDEAAPVKSELGDRNGEHGCLDALAMTRLTLAAEAIVKPRHVFDRKTDSFLGDDTMETRKITLTPNLLRDDTSTAVARPSEARDVGFHRIEYKILADDILAGAGPNQSESGDPRTSSSKRQIERGQEEA